MQTFLPYEDFRASARVLDRQRLGKQRVEAKQILQALERPGEPSGWGRHPAARMWRGYETALAQYGAIVTLTWRARGYKDTVLPFFLERLPRFHGRVSDRLEDGLYPPWLGCPDFHRAHRSALLRKYPAHYANYWLEDPDLPYIWPV